MASLIPYVRRYIVEIGDPRIDEAWCTCGKRFVAPRRWQLLEWSHRHCADHIRDDNA